MKFFFAFLISGIAVLAEKECAFFYQHGHGKGWKLVVEESEKASIGAAYDNRVSSIYVQPYCEVQLFRDSNFLPNLPKILQGNKELDGTLKKFNLPDLDSQWNDQVSSYKCHCEQGETFVLRPLLIRPGLGPGFGSRISYSDDEFNYERDCESTDEVCVVCDKTNMVGAVRMDAIFTESLTGTGSHSDQLLALAKFNSVANGAGCVTNMAYNDADVNNKHFSFDIVLGGCSMTSDTISHNGEKYIQFRQELTFYEPVMAVFFGSIGPYTFKCNYKATTSTEDKEYDVEVRAVGDEVEKFVAWDNAMSINFFSDATFTTEMTPNSLIVGDRFFYQVQWEETFTADMPVVFYAIDCTVNEKSNPSTSYKIIDDGCRSDLTQVTLKSTSAYAQNKLQYSYKSFAFSNTVAAVNLQLSCNIGFCLKTDVTAGSCGFDNICPTYYST